MSRSGYSDDYDNWALIKWRGQVASAIRGKRGQKLLRELASGLDATHEKVLIAGNLVNAEGNFCALGVVGNHRCMGEKLREIDPEDPDSVANAFDIATQLAQEIAFQNDENCPWIETPQDRWTRIRKWVSENINTPNVQDQGRAASCASAESQGSATETSSHMRSNVELSGSPALSASPSRT